MATSKKQKKQKKNYVHGSAAPKLDPVTESIGALSNIPVSESKVTQGRANSDNRYQQSAPTVSLFAIVGFLVIATLMIFVMLAQVNYNEILRETVRLNTHLDILREQQRVLAITFESAINMDEIERYAKDVLGMSKPEAEQVTVLRSMPMDRVEVIILEDDTVWWRDLRDYMTFLFDEYLR